MTLPIRISAPPPNGGHEDGEGSCYCDLVEINDWGAFEIVEALSGELATLLRQKSTSAYLVRTHGDMEVGPPFCHPDADDEPMYCAVDHLGRIERDPAANEALWRCANAAVELPGGHRLAEPARDRVKDLAARALAHDRSPVLDAVAESADGLRTPGRTRSRARRRSGPWRTARPRGGETLPLRVGPTPLSPSRPGYPSPSRRRRGSKPDRPVGHGCHAASHARHRRFVNQWIDYPTPLRRPLSRAAASCRRKDVREANMQMESVGGGVVMDPGPGTLPHFDLFARTLGDIDSPETMAWWSDPDWRGHVALAVITERGSARIASSSVILGGGRQAAPTAGSGDAGDRRAFLRREVERQRSASRSAIDRALAGLAFRPDGATFHVTSAFALRTVKAHLDVGSGWAGGTVRLGRETALRAGGGAASRSVPGVGDGHACGARAVDALADDLATWLERQYFHDDWSPDDTSQAALSHALAVMVAAHNGEISDSFAIGRAGSLPAPRSSAGGETGARSRLSDHHATGRAVTPLEPLA